VTRAGLAGAAAALVLGLAGGAGGYVLYRVLQAPDAAPAAPAPAAGIADRIDPPETRPEFTLPDPSGEMRSVSEWDGKLLVINFWATWCPPCLEEIPMFVDLQARHAGDGLQFVGIAIDQRENVVEFMRGQEMNYPVLLGQMGAIEVGKRYGNRLGALPYTVVVGRDGRIAFVKPGAMDEDEAEREIVGRL